MMCDDRKLLKDVYMKLPQPKDKIQCQYVWIDGSIRNLRTKTKTWPKEPQAVEELPVMEFCGSATDFDVGNEADYYSQPSKMYRDPFRQGKNKLIFCETCTRDGLPTFANNRHRLRLLREKVITEVTEFSLYQTYTLLRLDGKPLSYLESTYSPDSKSGFLCGRELAESHYRACLYAGIKMHSLEPVSNQGQFKYCIGPSSVVNLGDDVWMSRFLLLRVAEDFGLTVSIDPAYEWSNLEPLSVDIDFSTDHLIQPYRQRTIDDLFCKFGLNDNPLRMVTPSDKILLKGISSDVDPYSILARLLEAISHHQDL